MIELGAWRLLSPGSPEAIDGVRAMLFYIRSGDVYRTVMRSILL